MASGFAVEKKSIILRRFLARIITCITIFASFRRYKTIVLISPYTCLESMYINHVQITII
jgi:hypothetical protein